MSDAEREAQAHAVRTFQWAWDEAAKLAELRPEDRIEAAKALLRLRADHKRRRAS